MMNKETWICVQSLMNMFKGSYINSRLELILMKKGNIYFRLEDVKSSIDFKCKVIEWLSRPAIKYQQYNEFRHVYSGLDDYVSVKNYYGINKNELIRSRFLSAVNEILETNFNIEQMIKIYSRLGNGINRKLTLKFIESGFDLEVLKNE